MESEPLTDLTRGIYRRLYSGFITGQRINKLSLPAEAWFWRVLVSVDDFGNGRADPELCRAATAGKRKVTVRQVSGWLREMRDAGLIEFYTVKEEPLLHVVGFEELQPANTRNGKRYKKFPALKDGRHDFEKIEGAIGAKQTIQDAPLPLPLPLPETEPETERKRNPQRRAKRSADTRQGTRLPDDFCLNSEMREWASREVPAVDLKAALDEFVDYWHGVPGAKGRKLDWPATFRNRLRELKARTARFKEKKVEPSKPQARPLTLADIERMKDNS